MSKPKKQPKLILYIIGLYGRQNCMLDLESVWVIVAIGLGTRDSISRPSI